MGYVDISLGGSDEATALVLDIEDNMIKKLKKELSRKSNEFNTPGIINVAMYFDEIIIPSPYYSKDNGKDMIALAEKVVKKLIKYIDKNNNPDIWDDQQNKDYHLKAWRRLLHRMKDFVKKQKELENA